MCTHKTLAKWCLALTAIGIAPSWAAPFNPPPAPTLKNNSSLICSGGQLDPTGLAAYYLGTPSVSKAFDDGLPDFISALRAPDSQQGQRRMVVDAVNGEIQEMISEPANGFQIVTEPGTNGIPPFFSDAYNQLVVKCNKNTGNKLGPSPITAPPPTSATPIDNFRIRGTTDALLIPANTPLFKSATAATFSFSENGPTKTTTNALVTAVGYDFSFRKTSALSFDVIPFIAVNRNMSIVSSKPSPSNVENIMLGTTGAATALFAGPGGASDANTLAVTYEHIWNNINNSQLEFIHFLDLPIVGPFFDTSLFLNSYTPLTFGASVGQEWIGFTPLFDLRGDLGFYSKPAMDSSTTRNFQQIGSNFGIDIAFPRLKSDVTITQTLMGELESYRKNVSDFNVVSTYNITDNIGAKASYQNGNLETTGQRVQQWLLSASFKW